MMSLNCAAFPGHLIESELFGHTRGAFTGANTNRIGAFKEADGGTLFLDEIGEMPLTMQPRLLRVLEAREIKRVGENRERDADTWIIAATNRPCADPSWKISRGPVQTLKRHPDSYPFTSGA